MLTPATEGIIDRCGMRNMLILIMQKEQPYCPCGLLKHHPVAFSIFLLSKTVPPSVFCLLSSIFFYFSFNLLAINDCFAGMPLRHAGDYSCYFLPFFAAFFTTFFPHAFFPQAIILSFHKSITLRPYPRFPQITILIFTIDHYRNFLYPSSTLPNL
jgi:hypothetical protein